MADPLPWPEPDPIPEGWLDDTPPAAVAALRALSPARRLATSRALLAELVDRRGVRAQWDEVVGVR